MSDQRLYLADARSPRSERRRRQRQQQSSCCSCVVVIVSLLIALVALRGPLSSWWRERQPPEGPQRARAMFPLNLQIDARSYYRYELVRIDLQVVNPDGQPVKMAEPPAIVVRQGEEMVITVGGARKLVPQYDQESSTYRCYWPVPWQAEADRYLAEAHLPIADVGAWPWEIAGGKRKQTQKSDEVAVEGSGYCVAQVEFQIKNRPPPQIPPGLCAATWEADFPPGSVRRPDGSLGDWRAMLDWCEFIGADCLWFRGAVTETYHGPLSLEQPFAARNLEAIPRLAAAAHRRGLKFGAWAVAYATHPRETNKDKPAYDYAQDISRSTGKISEIDFISLLDPLRVEHLTDFFKQMQNTNNVDFIGLDYLRSEYGYEMVDQFAYEMPVALPRDWKNMTRKQRWLYVARIVEKERKTRRELDLYEHWNWWRAHRTAEIVKQIISEGQITKPVWVFLLSWMHGAQHGQDAAMLTDAGTTLITPMLYQVRSQEHFEAMLKSWQDYIDLGVANLAAGDQVDDQWHQYKRRPAAPELLYQRMMAAHLKLIDAKAPLAGRTIGGFWHDISRAAVRGKLGPYPGTEWALAGAAAFSQIRQSWRVYPLRVEMTAPDNAAIGASFTPRISIENLTDTDLEDIEILLENTPQIKPIGSGKKTVPKLGAGEVIRVPMGVKITRPNTARANRFMVAIRIKWPAGNYGPTVRSELPRTFVVMKYIQGT